MRTWGIHFITYLSPLTQTVLVVLAVAAAAGALLWKPSSRRPAANRDWLLALTAGVLFVLFRAATGILGDGELWINDLEAGAEPNPRVRAPILMRILGLIYPFFGSIGMDARFFLGLVSALSGVAVVLAWLRLGRLLNVPPFAVLLVGFSWGGIVLFFGYIEMYPPVAAAVTWMLVLMVSSLRTRRRSEAAGAVLLGLLALALNALSVVFLPVIAAFVAQFYFRASLSCRRVWLWTAGVLAGCAGIYFAAGWYRGTEFFLPLLPPPAFSDMNPTGFGLLSPAHWADIINVLALLALPVAVMALLVRRSIRWGAEWALIILALVFPLTALIVHSAQLSGARDWDIAATLLSAVPAAGILLAAEIRTNASGTNIYTTTSMAWLLLVVVPWIGVQHSEALTIRRFRDLMRTDPGASLSAWNFLGSYYKKQGDAEGWAESNREASKLSPNPRYNANLAYYHALKREWHEAEAQARTAAAQVWSDNVATEWERRVTDPSALRALAADYRRQFYMADAAHAERIAELLEGNPAVPNR